LGVRPSVAELISEENEEPITFERTGDHGRYIVIFDPLDGSSNIDVNVSVGTTFSVLHQSSEGALQPGHQQIAAGYVVYGSSTILVYTAGRGVFVFTLDPAVGAYVLSHDNMKMPAKGDIYSVNEAYANSFPEHYRTYIADLRKSGYKSRYIGSMVADYHRTLLKSGVFLYPPTAANAEGKLRLLYEANPIAFITEFAAAAPRPERSSSDDAAGGSARYVAEPRQRATKTPVMACEGKVSYFNAQKGSKPGQRTTSQTWVSTNALSQNWGWVILQDCP
jgi:fructose-1,6-bisphosphatase I